MLVESLCLNYTANTRLNNDCVSFLIIVIYNYSRLLNFSYYFICNCSKVYFKKAFLAVYVCGESPIEFADWSSLVISLESVKEVRWNWLLQIRGIQKECLFKGKAVQYLWYILFQVIRLQSCSPPSSCVAIFVNCTFCLLQKWFNWFPPPCGKASVISTCSSYWQVFIPY